VRSSCASRPAIASWYAAYCDSRARALAKLRDRSPISSPALELASVAQAPDARGQARGEQRERERADEQDRQHDVEQPFERTVALGQHAVGRLLDDHRAAHLVADPDRMRGRHDHRLAVGGRAPVGREDAVEGRFDVAPARRPARRRLVGELLRRLGEQAGVERVQRDALELGRRARQRASRRGFGFGRTLQRARAREHDEIAVDHPDPRRRARQSEHDLLDLRRRRRRQPGVAAALLGPLAREARDRVRGRREQARPLVQRDRHGLRGAGQRALLRIAEEALDLAHVFVAEPRQREKHRQDEQELRADAERDAHRQGTSAPSARQR
jgi:hypothetical protein